MASGFKINSPFLADQHVFLANTEEDALAEFGKRSGCEVKKVPYQTNSDALCIISSSGQMYRLLYDAEKRIYAGWGPARPVRPYGHRKGVIYYIGKSAVRAERMVYCAFVTGRWDDQIEIIFRDGDPYNVTLENLSPRQETDFSAWRMNIKEQTLIYQREWSNVVKYVQWECCLSREEAQDIVQDVFLELTDPRIYDHTRDFIGAWMFYGKKHGLNIYNRNTGLYVDLEDWHVQNYDKPMELDLLNMVGNEKHRDILRMKAQGYTDKEIADKYDSTPGGVQSIAKYAIKKIRAYCARDFKV